MKKRKPTISPEPRRAMFKMSSRAVMKALTRPKSRDMTPKEEQDYRDLLHNTLPDKIYKIEDEPWVAYTGKLGYMDYLVDLKKYSLTVVEGPGIRKQIEDSGKPYNTTMTVEQFEKALDEFLSNLNTPN